MPEELRGGCVVLICETREVRLSKAIAGVATASKVRVSMVSTGTIPAWLPFIESQQHCWYLALCNTRSNLNLRYQTEKTVKRLLYTRK